MPSLGGPEIQDPHSGQTHRVLSRPLSAVRWSGRGSTPLRRKPASATTIPKEKALLVKRWQSVAPAGQDLHSAGIEPGVHAVPVELDLVEPIGPLGGLLDERRELRLYPGR